MKLVLSVNKNRISAVLDPRVWVGALALFCALGVSPRQAKADSVTAKEKSSIKLGDDLHLGGAWPVIDYTPSPSSIVPNKMISPKDLKASGQEDALPWSEKGYSECGQSCLYQKGNENISLEASYVVNKLMALEDIENREPFLDVKAIASEMPDKCKNPDGSDISDHDCRREYTSKSLRAELMDFCAPDEDSFDCWHRYKRTEVAVLRKMRSAIIKNEDAVAKLANRNSPTVTGDSPVQASAPVMAIVTSPKYGNTGPLKPQVPYVLNWKDMQLLYQKEQHERAVQNRDASQAYQKWLEEDATKPPAQEDFVKFNTIHKDPKDPRSETIMTVARNPDGSVQYDKDAYARALKDFTGEKQLQEDREQVKKALEAHSKKLNEYYSKGGVPLLRTGDESISAFNNARAGIIRPVNAHMAALGLAAPQMGRKPGSLQKAAKTTAQLSGKNKPKISRDPGKIDEQVAEPPFRADHQDHFVFSRYDPNDLQDDIDMIEGVVKKQRPGAKQSAN